MRVVIDKAGRLVVPKAVRDKLRLEPGSELEVHVEEGTLVAQPIRPRVVVVERDGRPVFKTESAPPMTHDELLDVIHELREERLNELADPT